MRSPQEIARQVEDLVPKLRAIVGRATKAFEESTRDPFDDIADNYYRTLAQGIIEALPDPPRPTCVSCQYWRQAEDHRWRWAGYCQHNAFPHETDASDYDDRPMTSQDFGCLLHTPRSPQETP